MDAPVLPSCAPFCLSCPLTHTSPFSSPRIPVLDSPPPFLSVPRSPSVLSEAALSVPSPRAPAAPRHSPGTSSRGRDRSAHRRWGGGPVPVPSLPAGAPWAASAPPRRGLPALCRRRLLALRGEGGEAGGLSRDVRRVPARSGGPPPPPAPRPRHVFSLTSRRRRRCRREDAAPGGDSPPARVPAPRKAPAEVCRPPRCLVSLQLGGRLAGALLGGARGGRPEGAGGRGGRFSSPLLSAAPAPNGRLAGCARWQREALGPVGAGAARRRRWREGGGRRGRPGVGAPLPTARERRASGTSASFVGNGGERSSCSFELA